MKLFSACCITLRPARTTIKPILVWMWGVALNVLMLMQMVWNW